MVLERQRPLLSAHGTHALRRGADLATVRETLGHASLTTTGRYLRAKPGFREQRSAPCKAEVDLSVKVQSGKSAARSPVASLASTAGDGGGEA